MHFTPYVRDVPLADLHDLELWRHHPETLKLKAENALHPYVIQRFF